MEAISEGIAFPDLPTGDFLMNRFVVTAGSLLLVAICVDAADPKVEMLPPPKEAPSLLPPPKEAPDLLPPPKLVDVPMGPLGPILPGYFLPDRYAHWQLYAPDQQGYLKPRVIIALQPYYLYNGMPYRFLQTNPQVWSKNFNP
jgi:hypothetical protein